MSKSENQNLRIQEFEAKQNLVGVFDLLFKVDKRKNPHLYDNNRNTNNTNQAK